jgi:hypothetical protein
MSVVFVKHIGQPNPVRSRDRQTLVGWNNSPLDFVALTARLGCDLMESNRCIPAL